MRNTQSSRFAKPRVRLLAACGLLMLGSSVFRALAADTNEAAGELSSCKLFAQVLGLKVEHRTGKQAPTGSKVTRDIAYLPDRLTGGAEDKLLKLDAYLPEDAMLYNPCLVLLHGGGFKGGDKNEPWLQPVIERALAEGYAVINANYVVGRGMWPQFFWDIKNLMRFLRAQAEEYRIDRGRIACWGFSAGGTLALSSGLSVPNDSWACRIVRSALNEKPDREKIVHLQMDDPRADEYSSRVSACIADLADKNERWLSPDDPDILTYMGQGATHPLVAAANEKGVRASAIVLTDGHYRGSTACHVPAMESRVESLDGNGGSSLIDEVFVWLKRHLIEEPRTLPPEARPNRRIFSETVDVKLIAATGDAVIRFTTDGSDPTELSPIYRGPIAFTNTTMVKAIASRAGEQSSGVAAFVFTRGIPPPLIIAPTGLILPKAKVGQRYEVQFQAAEDGELVWNIAGHIQIERAIPKYGHGLAWDKRPVDPCDLRMNHATGKLSGTPTRTGTYTFQVHCARDWKEPADARVYVLVVE